MGRRSLEKIQGQNDLSRFLLKWTNLESNQSPVSLESLFCQKNLQESGALELEIGSGKGLFLHTAAQENPEHRFVGIEIAYRYALMCAARLNKTDSTNALVLNADAAQVLKEAVPPSSLYAVHVYFPDPWWKKAHRKRRILREDVLQMIERVLVPNGKLHFWTDVEEYFLSTLELIKRTTNLCGPFDVEEQELHDEEYRTHFERRTLLNEMPVYRVFFKKREAV